VVDRRSEAGETHHLGPVLEEFYEIFFSKMTQKEMEE